jgi:hypothetical protein
LLAIVAVFFFLRETPRPAPLTDVSWLPDAITYQIYLHVAIVKPQ